MAPGRQRSCGRVVRIDLHCAIQQIERAHGGTRIGREYERKRSHGQAVGVEVVRLLALRAFDLRAADLRQDRAHHAFGHPILQSEQVADVAVVGVAPDMRAGGGIEQTDDDAQASAAPRHAAHDQITRAEFSREPLQIGRRDALQRPWEDDRKGTHAAERCRDSFRHAFAEEAMFRIGGGDVARQDGDRRFLA